MKKVFLSILLLVLASPAMAQVKKVVPTPSPIPQVSLLQTLHDDAVAASADAASNSDVIAQKCYDAIAVIAQAKLTSVQTTGGGALLVFQKVRDFTRLNSSPQGTDLIIGCAPLVQDAKINFVQFFANIGGAVLLKGIIPIP